MNGLPSRILGARLYLEQTRGLLGRFELPRTRFMTPAKTDLLKICQYKMTMNNPYENII